MSRVLAVVLGVALGFLGVAAAFGTNHIGAGKQTQTIVDGTDVKIRGLTFNPRLNQCVMYITVLRNYSSPQRQHEAGLVICRDATVDTTCTSHYGMAEVWDGANYFCNRGNYFTVGTNYPVYVKKQSPSPGWTYSFAAGATHSINGYNAGDTVQAFTVGESTEPSGVGCPLTPHEAEFRDWQKMISWNWTFVSGVGYSGSIPSGLPVCWNFSSGATGDFDVF